ncbi:TPA: filamentous hemagglutinin N-terminal domain-containing protein, partial [Haemophilus influenzae]
MNKIYRLKFSKRLNALVAVSELTRGCDHSTEKGSEKPARMKVRHLALKPLSAMLLSLGVTSIPQSVLASGLQGMDVVHGTATMQVDGNKTIIRNSVDAIINWKQFNIDQNEMVQFLQENNNSAVFNRVTSNQISQLKGILDSNGQVFLINPNGVAIGKNAIINTNGFTASTLDISNENIKARNFTFEQTKDKALAEIVNHGLITVGKDGSVNLIGGNVKNKGVISVNGGSISLLAGQKITISDIANPTITYSIAAPENEAVNLGEIFAKGGNINIRAANIRNQGKLSADSVSKDKSGNIVLSAKEGEAEIGGVISAQNQQAKGGKLMITGDKVTLKTGAVIDLSGKEGGETYLGGDERGEGKNGIQLAKKTTLEKGSTINVSGKEKGGRAIVWGNIALIDGNINAQGKDIAKTGGFVETSGHDLFIGDNVIVDAKEWLLDPENVSIEAPAGRSDTSEDKEYMPGAGDISNPRKNNQSKSTLTNSTLETILRRGSFVNITATRKIYVNSSINLSNGSLTLYTHQDGIEINKDITTPDNNDDGANLTIRSGKWLDIHSNISVGENGTINISSADTFAIENKSTMISFFGGGNITIGANKGLRLENVSFKNKKPLNITTLSGVDNNFTANFSGILNISGVVNINRTTPRTVSIFKKGGWINWKVTQININPNSHFNLLSNTNGSATSQFPRQGLGGINISTNTIFNVAKSSSANFTFIYPIAQVTNRYHSTINGNLTIKGGGLVAMKFSSYDNTFYTAGIGINSRFINVTDGSSLDIKGDMPAKKIFEINNDLTINAADSNVSIKEVEGIDSALEYGLFAKNNITINGGNVTLGSNKAKTEIKGNVNVSQGTNVTLQAQTFGGGKKALVVGRDINNKGNLTANGAVVEVKGNVTVKEGAIFKGETIDNLNITGTFTNNGTANINIKQGVVKLGDITNNGSLNITTNASGNQKTIINGNITNKKGNLNITNNKANAEIQIGGNISQKEGNLTISSDKVNITKRITIKAGVEEGGSSSSATNNANLTIKTKTLELTNDLNISGFNKAEITAKDNSDLTIDKSSGGDGDAKKVTFDKVKDSKISAKGHGVTLNSKVESSGDSSTENGSDGNNIGLTISAKDVTVNNNITSQKTVSISASEGGITTKAGTTINATTGSVEVTAKTGDIKGGIESASGSVTLTATGATLAVGNISGNTVTITANDGKLTTTENSIINATASSVTISTKQGELKGAVEAKQGAVDITAKEGALTISNVTAKNNVAVKAETGKLTTTSGGMIKSEGSKVELTAQSGLINGDVVAGEDSVAITASAGGLSVANVTGKTATLTAESGKLTTQAGSTISGTDSVTTLSQSGDIGGTISG